MACLTLEEARDYYSKEELSDHELTALVEAIDLFQQIVLDQGRVRFENSSPVVYSETKRDNTATVKASK